LGSTTGFGAFASFVFDGRLTGAKTFGALIAFGFADAGVFGATGFAFLTALFRVFFATIFLAALTGFAFEIFAPVLARPPVVRAERGLMAVFFGFFMATIGNGVRLLLESTPGISAAQREFDFEAATTLRDQLCSKSSEILLSGSPQNHRIKTNRNLLAKGTFGSRFH
jgi:hypothetical protein